jgi:hypothetical protein
MAQASPNSSETVEARQFVLRDGSGNVRAVLGVSPEGAVGLNLDDTTGRTRLTLDVDYAGSPDWTSSIKVANAGPLSPWVRMASPAPVYTTQRVNFALAWTFRAPILPA